MGGIYTVELRTQKGGNKAESRIVSLPAQQDYVPNCDRIILEATSRSQATNWNILI